MAGGGCVIYYPERRCVVGLHWRRGLGEAHFDEGMPGRDCFSEIELENSEFGLGGGRHNGFNYLVDL